MEHKRFKEWIIAREGKIEDLDSLIMHGYMPPRMDFQPNQNRMNPQTPRHKDEIPDVVRLRFKPITKTLNKISMERRVGTSPLNAEKLLKTLQSYSTRSYQNEMTWEEFEDLCKAFKVDPIKLYGDIA